MNFCINLFQWTTEIIQRFIGPLKFEKFSPFLSHLRWFKESSVNFPGESLLSKHLINPSSFLSFYLQSDDSGLYSVGFEKDMLLTTSDSSTLSANEVAGRLRVEIRTGLRWSEAKNRAKIIGYNELHAPDEDPTWKKYIEQFKNPLILLLLGSALVSICMRQFDDAISITIAIIIVVTVAFIQEYRSEKSLEELKKLVPPECHW